MSFLNTLLKLGRVSNLPTVWSNILLATLVCGGSVLFIIPESFILGAEPFFLFTYLLFFVGGSLAYVGGMFLNDAFDADYDRLQQKFRPIPSGEISRSAVFAFGFFLLVASAFPFFILKVVFSRPLADGFPEPYDFSQPGFLQAMSLYLGLVICIVGYNWIHKKVLSSFLLMAGARAFLILLAADISADGLPIEAIVIAGANFFYVCALTLIARNESSLPWFQGRIAQLIAGICLLDLLLTLVFVGVSAASLVFVLFFVLTLRLQRWVRGT